MGKATGFMEYRRQGPDRRPVPERVRDWNEIYRPFPILKVREQGARCMDCGIPFCQQGCPLGNLIPDWNDLAFRDQWQNAVKRLHVTNNFPEFTGRLCPAPCEPSCVLGVVDDPVTIKLIEQSIIDRAWEEGWVQPEPPQALTGKQVAVVGSGPAGLACAQQLARAGHQVTVFERADRAGGLLRYGIPQFKMEKRCLERRLAQMEAEGVAFRTGVEVGVDVDGDTLRGEYDAVVLAGGATQARELPIPGRELKGIYQAMHFLPMANRYSMGDFREQGGEIRVRGTPPYGSAEDWEPYVTAEGKNVIIIGGGDTGADCLGTVHRQGCAGVVQFQIHPRPPEQRDADNPWPQWPNIFQVSGAHEEGCRREFGVKTLEFLPDATGRARALRTVQVERRTCDGRALFLEVPGTETVWEAGLILLATGFSGPERSPVLEQLGVGYNVRGNVRADGARMTDVPGVFACGDTARGQSLIVWAIAEGRQAASGVDAYLMGATDLPRPLDMGNDQRPFV
jgi:glutamate synthase (NADPH/NADH) small chain